jgi:putative lipoprotein
MLFQSMTSAELYLEKPKSLVYYMQSFQREKDYELKDIWFAQDKARHLIGSLYGTVLIGQVGKRFGEYSLSKSNTIAVGSVFIFGLAKEIYDAQKPTNFFSWKDITANAVGILIGIILMGIK